VAGAHGPCTGVDVGRHAALVDKGAPLGLPQLPPTHPGTLAPCAPHSPPIVPNHCCSWGVMCVWAACCFGRCQVREAVPTCLVVLDTQDLHFLRHAREACVQAGTCVHDRGPTVTKGAGLGQRVARGRGGQGRQGRAGEGRGVCGSYEGDVPARTERQGRGTLCPGPYPLLATQMCIATPSSRTLHPIPHPVWVAAGGSVLDSLAAVVPPVATGASPEYAARAGALEALVGEAAGLAWA
jgi:hypothetical protein